MSLTVPSVYVVLVVFVVAGSVLAYIGVKLDRWMGKKIDRFFEKRLAKKMEETRL